jgi:hypothetical protein
MPQDLLAIVVYQNPVKFVITILMMMKTERPIAQTLIVHLTQVVVEEEAEGVVEVEEAEGVVEGIRVKPHVEGRCQTELVKVVV